jgi:hypothetical protein
MQVRTGNVLLKRVNVKCPVLKRSLSHLNLQAALINDDVFRVLDIIRLHCTITAGNYVTCCNIPDVEPLEGSNESQAVHDLACSQ